MLVMRNPTSVFLLTLCLFLGSCAGGKLVTWYVLVPPSKAAALFSQDLALLAKRHGLTPHLGSATDSKGHTLHVLEANGRGMRLWSQNVELSGEEDPKLCGSYGEPHPDEGQYVVSIGPELSFMNSANAAEVASQLRLELSVLG